MLFNESPRLFRESILLIFSGELQTNPIQFSHPHFKSFQMSRKVSTNSTADIIQNMTMSCLFDLLEKSLIFEKFWEIFYQKSSFLYVLWTIKRHFNISSKNSHQSIDSFYYILAQILYEKFNKMLSPNNLGFIDVNLTVNDNHHALIFVRIVMKRYNVKDCNTTKLVCALVNFVPSTFLYTFL